MYRYLEVIEYATQLPVKRFNITGKNALSVELLDGGINRNMNHEDFYTATRESEVELTELK